MDSLRVADFCYEGTIPKSEYHIAYNLLNEITTKFPTGIDWDDGPSGLCKTEDDAKTISQYLLKNYPSLVAGDGIIPQNEAHGQLFIRRYVALRCSEEKLISVVDELFDLLDYKDILAKHILIESAKRGSN